MADSIDGLLFDNDALSLLGAARVIELSLAVLGIDPTRAFRLGSLTPMLCRGQIGREWQQSTRNLARQEAERIQVWRSQPDADLLDRFVPIVGIDPGEAFVYATLVEHPTYVLVSGDKRSMAALCAAADLQDIEDAISGRVIWLEQLLNELVEGHGVQVIGQAFPLVLSHKTLSVVFTQTTMASQEQCLYAINAYIRALQQDVGPAFLLEFGNR